MVDTGFWGGIVPDNAGHHNTLQSMVDAGVLGFKSFMIPSGPPAFCGLPTAECTASSIPFSLLCQRMDRDLEEAQFAAVYKKLMALTCSCPACAGINDFPNVGEEDIRKALPFLKKAGVPYYVHAELQQDDSSPVHFAPFVFSRPCQSLAPW